MSNLKAHFGLAVESAAEAAAAVSEVATMPVTSAELVTPEDGPIAEANAEVAAEVEAAGGLEEATVALEQLHAILSEALDDGGMSRQTARVTQVAVDMAHRRMGLSPRALTFENDMPPMARTRLTMESISESMKAAWDGFIAFCLRIWAAIKNVYLNLTSKARRLRQQATKLSELAKAIAPGTKATAREVELGELAKWMYFNDTKAAGPVDWLETTNASVRDGVDNVLKTATDAVDGLVKTLGSIDASDRGSLSFTVKMLGAQPAGYMTAVGSPQGEGVTARQQYIAGVMPGGLNLVANLPAPNAFTAYESAPEDQRVQAVGRDHYVLQPSEKQPTVEKVYVLETVQLEELASYIAVMCGDYESYMGKIADFEKHLSQKLNTLRSAMGKIQNTVNVGHGEAGKWNRVLAATQRVQSSRFAQLTTMGEYNLRAGSAYLHVVSKMLGLYATATPAAAPAAAPAPAAA